MGRDGVGKRQIARHGPDHHFSHLVVFRRVGVDVLYAPQGRVGLVGVVEGAQRFDNFFGEAGDFQLLAEEVEVEERADVFFRGRVSQGFTVEPADEELWNKKRGLVSSGVVYGGEKRGKFWGVVYFEGRIVCFWETEVLGFGRLVLFRVEDVGEEAGVVA